MRQAGVSVPSEAPRSDHEWEESPVPLDSSAHAQPSAPAPPKRNVPVRSGVTAPTRSRASGTEPPARGGPARPGARAPGSVVRGVPVRSGVAAPTRSSIDAPGRPALGGSSGPAQTPRPVAVPRQAAVPRKAAAPRPAAAPRSATSAGPRSATSAGPRSAASEPPRSAGPARPGEGVPGRRTVTIRGHGSERNLTYSSRSSRRRPSERPYERAGFKPERVAMWAVLLGLVLILVAATSSHAAIGSHARPHVSTAPPAALVQHLSPPALAGRAQR